MDWIFTRSNASGPDTRVISIEPGPENHEAFKINAVEMCAHV